MAMRTIFWLLSMIFLVSCTDAQRKQVDSKEVKSGFVLIELFTSQGCSSCPPADDLLSETVSSAEKSGANIIALSYHVDYWNRLGWKDPFSEPAFTARQQIYVRQMGLNGAYTPQMVVNGTKEFVGSNKSALKNAIEDFSDIEPIANVSISDAVFKDGLVSLKYDATGIKADDEIILCLVALKEVTSIKRGENGGRTLTNINVVRQMSEPLKTASGKYEFNQTTDLSVENTAIVALIQNKETLEIKAAVMKMLK